MNLDNKTIEAMQKAMAVIIAEHEVMRNRLIELDEIFSGVPLRWCKNGEPIVNLEKTIAEWVRSKEHERSSGDQG